MNVTFTPEPEQLVNGKVKSGAYHSDSEVVSEGLHLLKEQDNIRENRINQLRDELAIGANQIDSGQYTDYDTEDLQWLVDEIQCECRKRLANRRDAAVQLSASIPLLD